MNIISINLGALKEEKEKIRSIIAVIQSGGIVAFPSDTCYGFAADPNNPHAIEKLFTLKKRSREKSVSCIFPSLKSIELWAEMDDYVRDILRRNIPGPFTFLLSASHNYPLGDQKIGVRMPDFLFTQKLGRMLGAPYTATSANVSGESPPYSHEEIIKRFENEAVWPDLVITAGVLPKNAPSTVIDLSRTPPTIIRRGERVPKL